jgi:glycosyltransferase involved in cell wall biosynthesis
MTFHRATRPVGSGTFCASSRRMTLLEHFRIPHEVDSELRSGGCEQLRMLSSGRALRWPAELSGEAVGADMLGADGKTTMAIFARVLPSVAAEAMLSDLGEEWRRVTRITDVDGRDIGSVWENAGGDVFVPFDPDEVILNYWSGRHTTAGSRARGAVRRKAVRAYYLVRPLMPRAVQIRLRRASARVHARRGFGAGPTETSLHDYFDLMLAILASVAEAPVPTIAPWPGDYGWALVLTHEVDLACGSEAREPVIGLERARGFRSAWNTVELPVSLLQDRTLSVIHGHGSESSWVEKARFLRSRGGLARIDTHPDRLRDEPVLRAYGRFLDRFAPDPSVWKALPAEVSAWWRERDESSLVRDGDGWKVVGPAGQDARVALAGARWATREDMQTPAPSKAERVTMLLENNPYPQDIRVRQEAESLAGAGHTVEVIAPRARGQAARERVNGVDVRRFRSFSTASQGAKAILLEYVVAMVALHLAAARALLRGSTVLHLHNPPDLLFPAGAIFRLARRRVVFDHHDLAPELAKVKFGSPLLVAATRVAERLTFGVASHVLAANASHAEIALGRGGKRPTDVTVVRNGPRQAWTRLPVNARAGRLDSIRLAYLGTIADQDGLEEMAEVLALLRDEHPDLRATLLVVGDGDGRANFEAALERFDVSANVTITGWVPLEQVPSFLADADVCVDPAPATELNQRSTMIKVAEYLALGKPVVAYDLLETSRTVHDAGLLVPHGDTKMFADRIALLARDPELRSRLSLRARQRSLALTWTNSESALLAAYAGLSGNGREAAGARRRRVYLRT